MSPRQANDGSLSVATTDITGDTNSVSLSAASQLAMGFLKDRNKSVSYTINSSQTITDKEGLPYFHVVNMDPGGFVVLSASKLYPSILAYNDKGYFGIDNPPIGIRRWLNKHASNIQGVRNLNTAKLDSIRTKNKRQWTGLLHKYVPSFRQPATSLKSDLLIQPTPATSINPPPPPTFTIDGYFTVAINIGPLCGTSWDQGCNYNTYCPTNGETPTTANNCGHDVAGCLPVSMAQIMYFWKLPASYNMETTMSLTAGTPSEAQLIGDIGSHTVGSGTFASYSAGSTTCDDTYCADVFSDFGYKNVSRSETISAQELSGAQNGTSYSTLLINELLNNQRPCIITGSTGENDIIGIGYTPYTDRHSWVCEGIQQTQYWETITETTYGTLGGIIDQYTYSNYLSASASMLYMNWGLGGVSNGWYNSTTDYSDDYSAGKDYSYFQTIVYNIYPS